LGRFFTFVLSEVTVGFRQGEHHGASGSSLLAASEKFSARAIVAIFPRTLDAKELPAPLLHS
jgi:hypothetical protein